MVNLFDRAGEVAIGHSSSRCIETDSPSRNSSLWLGKLRRPYFTYYSSMKAEVFNGKNGKGWPAKTKENTTCCLFIKLHGSHRLYRVEFQRLSLYDRGIRKVALIWKRNWPLIHSENPYPLPNTKRSIYKDSLSRNNWIEASDRMPAYFLIRHKSRIVVLDSTYIWSQVAFREWA